MEIIYFPQLKKMIKDKRGKKQMVSYFVGNRILAIHPFLKIIYFFPAHDKVISLKLRLKIKLDAA